MAYLASGDDEGNPFGHVGSHTSTYGHGLHGVGWESELLLDSQVGVSEIVAFANFEAEVATSIGLGMRVRRRNHVCKHVGYADAVYQDGVPTTLAFVDKHTRVGHDDERLVLADLDKRVCTHHLECAADHGHQAHVFGMQEGFRGNVSRFVKVAKIVSHDTTFSVESVWKCGQGLRTACCVHVAMLLVRCGELMLWHRW